MHREVAISILLVVATCAAFAAVGRSDFVRYDDDLYVSENPRVQAGLTLEGAGWAFSTLEAGNWHPATWLSHMLDVELFGMDPGAHHRSSLALHALNGVLLFLLLRWTTGALWRSAFVAALFALHPMHVESVAWIAERKDVLSALFWLLSTLAYARYTRNSSPSYYALALGLFALGLMAKPMLVTLPLVLLLLDVWPLGRTRLCPPARGPGGRPVSLAWLLAEKLPWLGLAALSSLVTLAAQTAGGAVKDLSLHTLATRAATALVAYAAYAWKALWPSDLAVFYPHPLVWPVWQVAGAAVFVVAVSALALANARRRPWLAVGWLWYLGTLVPVIGLVQIGNQWRADRYSYLPLIGLFILVSWGASELLSRWRHSRSALAVAGAAIVALCGVTTAAQVQHWRSTETLFQRALAATPDNYVAHTALASERAREGKLALAIDGYRTALGINPDYGVAHYNLAKALVLENRLDEAVVHFRALLELRPDDPEAHFILGYVAQRQGDLAQAAAHLTSGLALEPDAVEARTQLGVAELQLGRTREAVRSFRRALAVDPDARQALFYLATVLATDDDPGLRDPTQAVRMAERLCSGQTDPAAIEVWTLGTAYAAAGRRFEAAASMDRAARLARQAGQLELALRAEARARAYRAN
jgi:tetratricopeptide (TPR) repeat protein